MFATCLDTANVEPLARRHPGLRALALDVSDFDRIAAIANELADEPIDLLLSNAAAGSNFLGDHNPAFGSLDDATWSSMLRINTLGAISLWRSG